MRTLIVGAGIAGPALAHWLRRAGHEVTLVEKSPELRTGGYLIDFWGAGFDIAKQDGARGLGTAFAPLTRGKLRLRNALMRMMDVRLVANLVMGRSLRDPIEVPAWPTA
ncbi:FAD-dependent oxidoreductase [Microbacterium sp. Mu-80]|uniref:FAD-dependent oxidoreductase n=1 Tax=Microbacterium bandirmense TaxID=3122050 RepID=A0ABU8L770_9MICO